MARALEFLYDGQSFRCEIEKVDRSKLYGAVTVEAHDADGAKCRLMTLANDGRTLIPSGSTAFAYLSRDGQWLERSDLKPVDQRGHVLNPVSSSFSNPIELDVRTTTDRFLEHSTRLAYALRPADGEDHPEAFTKVLGEGAIFKIDFSYRGGAKADPAFVMQGQDGTAWLLVSDENNVNYVTLEQSAGLAGDGEDEADLDALDFDFV